MSAERQQRITDLHDALVVQAAIVVEIERDLRAAGMEEADAAQGIVDDLRRDVDGAERVRVAVPKIRALASRMAAIGRTHFADALAAVRGVLTARADVTLVETQPIGLADLD